jgi:hypothetical protein
MDMNGTEAKQKDEVFERKYRKLNPDYLDRVDDHVNLDDVKNNLVSIEEADCITNYSGNVSSCVHYALKNGYIEHTVLIKEFEQRLFNGLLRMPSYDDQTVYRMEIHSPCISDYQKYFADMLHKVIAVPYYLSTSKVQWEDEIVVYKIRTLKQNSRARDISRVTNSAWEKEVLFLKDSRFKVIGIVEKEGVLEIGMEETEASADVIYNYVLIGYDASKVNTDEEPGLFD